MRLISKLPITTKLLIILLLISILPLFIIIYGFYSLGKAKLTEQTIHVLEVQSKNVAASIDHFIDYRFKHLSRIANIPQLTRILKNVKEQPHITRQTISSLRAKLRMDPDFLSFSLMDAEGNVVLSTSNTPTIDFGARPFFFEAVKGEKYVSAPSLDEGKPSIYFSIPVTHADKILGVLVAQCDAEELWKLIETETGRVGAGNAVILSNSDGVRIAHSTTRELIFKSWIPLKPEVEEQILQEKRYGSDIKKIASTDIPEVMDAVTMPLPPRYFQHGLVIGKETYHSAIRVMDNGWRIISTVPESTFLEPVHTNIFYMGIISSIIACMVIAASIIIGRLSTKRINLLASISEEILDGNFTKVVPFANGDEIGQLGKAFNTMTVSIRDRIEQLKTLYTEEKRLREELKKKNKELEELTENLENKVFERTKEFEKINKELSKANELKGRFIANASHELRTPLHSIIGFSEILLQKTFGELNEKQQRYTNTIYNSGKHLIHLVNNILDLAKIEAGKMELSYQTFPLKTTVDEVLMVLKPLAEQKRIETKIEMSSEVKSFTADKIKFKQILYNLLSNAIKFTPEGGTVGINIEKARGNKEILPWALESQRLLKVSVWDTGVGIRAEDREIIFEEFEQLDPSKSTEGTGLGLSLTKKLVELHGGQIEVGGTYGQGAIFNVYLPFVIHEEQAMIPKPIFPPIAETHLKEECPLVLVVEDDIPTVEILTIHLTQAGYRVAHAYDGEEAILKAKELKPFAITLDIMLPKKDGWEVLQSLKADPETRDIPVIIHSIIENKELAFALGATDYMVKPVDKSTLLEKLVWCPVNN